MFEKVNPSHPDKIADRIAGALVDYAYTQETSPKIAIEVLLGHGYCTIIAETSVHIPKNIIKAILNRIVGNIKLKYIEVPQDKYLAKNQESSVRCGDNGIFKGVPVTKEQIELTNIATELYTMFNSDGKYIINNGKYIICQSNDFENKLSELFPNDIVNPLGNWTGGLLVDSGATNRKLGSDMGDSVTGGGLHGKDLSKADVSVNIYAWLEAQKQGRPVEFCCAIGDSYINGKPYEEIVQIAKDYINFIGGFEKFAEWGLVSIKGLNFLS